MIRDWLGLGAGGCGGCLELLKEMDAKGPAWVRDNMSRIVPQIRDNAKRNKNWWAQIAAHIPGVKVPIRAMVLTAIVRHESQVAAEQLAKEKQVGEQKNVADNQPQSETAGKEADNHAQEPNADAGTVD